VIAPPAAYPAKAARYAAERDREAAVSLRISRLRLATFLPAAACVIWVLTRGFTIAPVVIGAALFAAFGALVVWHARVEDRVAWFDALRLVNVRAEARVKRDWKTLPTGDPPLDLDLTNHPYALDLDVFGRASLYQWLGPAGTAGGAARLADWLLHTVEASEVQARQAAAEALAAEPDWREQFAARGYLAAEASAPQMRIFLEWAEGSHPFGRYATLVRVLVLTLTLSIWGLILLHALGVIATALWLVPMLAGMILSFALAWPITTAFDRAGGGQLALRGYARLFAHAETVPAAAPRLSVLRDQLTAAGAPASACMRRLNRILGFGDLRRGAAIFHFVIQAVSLWDFHVLDWLERWRVSTGMRVRGWLDALAQLDAHALAASVRADNPDWALPQIVAEPRVDAVALGHPLIPDDRRVANDVSVGPPGTLLLITGSNMSGKSTLLRAVGLNAVLAQSGAAVCATRFQLPHLDVQTSIRVQDSLELGLSYFMAALARLKGVVDAAEHERPGRVLLYLLDEILQGTNSAERGIAVRAVARHLLEAGAIGAMTTHDLNLAGEEPLRSAAQLVHFTEIVDEQGTMRFDYHLRPGLATSRNALRLMQMIGIDL
jgi:hypothetical protein